MLRAALAQAVVEAAAEMRGGVWASVGRDDVARLADAAAERCAVVLLGPSPVAAPPKCVLPPIEAPQGGAGRPSGSPGQADEGDVLPGATGAPPPAAQRPVGAAPGERDAGPSGAPRDTRAFSGAHLVPRGPRRSSILHVEPPTEDVGAADSASGQWVVEAPSASAEEREAMVQELLRLWGASWLRFLWRGRRTRAVGQLFLWVVAMGAVLGVFLPLASISLLFRLLFAFVAVSSLLGWRWGLPAMFELAPLLLSLSRAVPDDRRRVVRRRGTLILFSLTVGLFVGLSTRLIWYGNADDYLIVLSFLGVNFPLFSLALIPLLCAVGSLSEVGEVVRHLQGKLDGESGSLDIETVRSRVASHAALVARVGEAFGPAVDVWALCLAVGALVYLIGAILGIEWAPGTPELVEGYMFYLLTATQGFLLTTALSSASLALRRTLQRINDLALQEDGPASLEATTEHMRLVQRLQTMREFFGFRVFGMLVTPELITQVGSALASVFLFGLARLFF